MDVTTTLQGEKVGMTIDQSALAHIMSVLTDLYSDPELAVIREYSTNAFDAHVEVGQKRPIEVTLPSALSPFLKIKDYGVGLNVDDIREIYSRYGTSTKRDSNDVVGMLGLGCKSALTYTDQFTLTGVKDGMRVVVAVSRDEDGAGSMTIVDYCETDEPSGVEVTIPAKQGNQFETKAADFFRFWTPGTVLVNGKQPERIDGLWIADDLLITNECQAQVVMGNVAYPMNESGSYGYGYRNGWNLVAFVDIGEVHFTPSREALQMTPKTKATLKTLQDREVKERDKALAKMVAEAKTYPEAVKVANSCRAYNRSFEGTYKGERVPPHFENMGDIVTVDPAPRYRTKGWGKAKHVNATVDAVWIVNYDSDAFTPYKREKLNQWAQKKGIKQPSVYVFTQLSHAGGYDRLQAVTQADGTIITPKSMEKWIDPKRVFDWSEIKAEKIIREDRGDRSDGRPRGSYDLWIGSSRHQGIDAGEIDTTKPLFWYHGGQWSNPVGHKLLLEKYGETSTFVQLSANRIEKFKRDFPMAKSCDLEVRELARTYTSTISADVLKAVNVQRHRWHTELRDLNPERVDDPALKAAITLSKAKVGTVMDKITMYTRIDAQAAPKWETLTNPLEGYPLLRHTGYLSRSEMDHVYLYLNAAYAARVAAEAAKQAAKDAAA